MNILSQLMDESTRLPAIIALLYRVPAVLIALTLHELAHGYVALRCGDPTAQMLGRLTFNPLRHLDPIGTLFMFLFGFGWARPVPVNPRNFKRFRRDDFLVSAAGVTVNFLLFLFSTLLMILCLRFLYQPDMWQISLGGGLFEGAQKLNTPADFLSFDGYNFYLRYTNQPQLAVGALGDSVWLAPIEEFVYLPWLQYVHRFLMDFSMVNIGLALFHLLPTPPMDGYRLVNDVFAKGRLRIPQNVMNGIMVALMVLLFASNSFSALLSRAIYTVQGGIVKALLFLFGMA